jgi:hypothetical protein
MTTDQVENCLQIRHGSKNEIILNRLGFHKILKQMTDALKRKLLYTCQRLLNG